MSDIPAFPVHPGVQIDGPVASFQGMTLRDYFAAAALQGFCSMSDTTGHWAWDADGAAATAYEIADAMIAERSKRDA